MNKNKENQILKQFLDKYTESKNIETSYTHLVDLYSTVELEYFFPKKYSSILKLLTAQIIENIEFKSNESISGGVKYILSKLLENIEKDRNFFIDLIDRLSFAEKIKLSCFCADLIWKKTQDSSTDFNFYSKRIILSKIVLIIVDSWKNIDFSFANKQIDEELVKVKKFSRIKSKVLHISEKFSNIPLIRFTKLKLKKILNRAVNE